jgi:transposase
VKPISKPLFIGIDLSGTNNVVQFVNSEGKFARRSLTIAHSPEGVKQFVSAVDSLMKADGYDNIQIGMEATGIYWWHMCEYLREEPLLQQVNSSIFLINPSLVKALKKALSAHMPKTDAIDAYVIAQRVKLGDLKPISETDFRYMPLARLTRFRMTLVESLSSDKNRACQLIFLKCSEYLKVAEKRSFAKGPLALLEEFTANELLDKPLEELLEILIANTNNRFENPQGFLDELRKAARNSYRLSSKMNDSVSIALSMTLDNIRFFESQCSKLEKVIARELKAIPQTLDTIPGIGPVFTAGIVSEIGDINRFPNESALASFAGLTWTVNQSGNYQAEETSLTKAGNHYLRYYLVEAANSLRVHNSEFAAFYRKKYSEVTKHQHKRALVLTARKFVRLVYAMLSTGQIYRERR